MTRISLLVDHPLRDLDGQVLLAAHLAAGGAAVSLVPMYEKHEVWTIQPDLVVLNYLRYAHASFVRTCRHAGVAIAVLDTEGGVRGDFAGFDAQVEPYLDGTALYCVWGRVQAEALQAVTARHGVRLVETGSPRYDFAVDPWRSALGDVDVPDGPMILVNTNFPLVNSRFQDADREVQELVRTGTDEARARARIGQTRTAFDEMLAVVRRLAGAGTGATIVIRPHPFEAAAAYEAACGDLPGVIVRQHGPVFAWIRRASVLVHHNCSTAIEAALMGVEPVMIDWLDTPLLDQPATADVSRRMASPDDLVAAVEAAVRGPLPPAPPDIVAARDRIVRDFFHANDGRAAERAAAVVAGAARAAAPGRLTRRAYVRRIVTAPPGVAGQVRRAVLMVAGNGAYRLLRSVAGRTRMTAAKHFGVGDVADVLGRLAAVRPDWPALRARAAGHAAVEVVTA